MGGLLSSADTGEVYLDGQRASARGASHGLRRYKVGMVFQQINILAELSVLDNLVVAAASSATRADLLARLKAWGLDELGGRLGKQLSGGQAQRVAFCRALINDPVLLLADEPTSGLDETNAGRVFESLREARDHGRAIVGASHDARMAQVADRVIDMKDGRLV